MKILDGTHDTDQHIPYAGGDFFCERTECDSLQDDGTIIKAKHTCSGIRTNVPRTVWQHSPTGYNFGYSGSGPTDLALNVLLYACNGEQMARNLTQDFREEFVAPASGDEWRISAQALADWLRSRGAALSLAFQGCNLIAPYTK